MDAIRHFVIIDDEQINNTICTVVLKRLVKDAVVNTFTNAREGLKHLQETYSDKSHDHKVIFFLDLRMPELTGWDVLDLYEEFHHEIKSRIKVYILSSSMATDDMERARKNPHVIYYLVKPLTKESFNLIMM